MSFVLIKIDSERKVENYGKKKSKRILSGFQNKNRLGSAQARANASRNRIQRVKVAMSDKNR